MRQLGVAAQVLHDALGGRIGRLTPVRAKPVMRCETDIVGGGHDHVGDHPTLQTAHPIGQHLRRDPADHGQRLGDHRQRRRRFLIGGEAHEPPPRERQHRAEHEQPRRGLGPVDHQILTRRPHRRAATPMIVLAPPRFLLGHQPTKVPRRPVITSGFSDRQQPLSRDPAPRLAHPLGDQVAHRIEIARTRLPRRWPTGLRALDSTFDRLMGRAAQLGGSPVGSDLPIGRDDVHTLPCRLKWNSLGGEVTCWRNHRHRPGHEFPGPTRRARELGTSTWPPMGTSIWPSAGTYSWP